VRGDRSCGSGHGVECREPRDLGFDNINLLLDHDLVRVARDHFYPVLLAGLHVDYAVPTAGEKGPLAVRRNPVLGQIRAHHTRSLHLESVVAKVRISHVELFIKEESLQYGVDPPPLSVPHFPVDLIGLEGLVVESVDSIYLQQYLEDFAMCWSLKLPRPPTTDGMRVHDVAPTTTATSRDHHLHRPPPTVRACMM
jgi:hypothetical protein